MNLLKRSALTTLSLSIIACFSIAGGSAFAAASGSGATANTSGALTTAQQTDLANLKAKGSAEISRRLASLNSAASKINSDTKLSASDKSYLQSEVNTEISGLTTLQITLNGETQLSAARTDVKNIFNDYRVYALLLPKIRLITAADGEQTTDTKLSALATQIQAKITTDQNAGKNIATEQVDLTDMESKTSSAQSIASSLESNVLTLQPSDYNTDHSILSGDLSKLQTAHSDNAAAYAEAKTIVSDLKNL